MSTFSGLNTAFRGLTAARQGIEVGGQNIANANTDGYTRQRVVSSSVPAAGVAGLARSGIRPGEGVSVDAIARLGDEILDTRVRSSAATSGYWTARADTASTLEASLREPGRNGLSAQLDDFFSAWHDMALRPGDPAPANVLIEEGQSLAARVSSGWNEVADQWSGARRKADDLAAELNNAGQQVAQLNTAIRTSLVTGGMPNEMIDQRSVLLTSIASLAGGTTLAHADGTVDVFVGGNALVSGERANSVTVIGARLLDGLASSPVGLEWTGRAGIAVALDGGTIAGTLSVLAPATATRTGGTLAEAAAAYDSLATELVGRVNALHSAGATSAGTTGLDFFRLSAGVSAARGLGVVPMSVDGIASGNPGSGGRDGSIASAISALATGAGTPTALWTAIVTGIGAGTRSDLQQADVAALTSSAAVGQQRASASVDVDEENVSLLTYQSAYQAAARVMSAVDQMLDTLINRTGMVGR